MGKILFVGRIILGVGLIFFVASNLATFGSVQDLFLGAALMLLGVTCGFLVDRHFKRWLLALVPAYAAVVIFGGVLGYFAGGYVVYFGCYMFARRKDSTYVQDGVVKCGKM